MARQSHRQHMRLRKRGRVPGRGAQRGTKRGAKRRHEQRWLRRGAGLLLGALLLPVGLIGLLRVVPPVTSAFMLQRQWQALGADEPDFVLAYDWVPLDEIDPQVQLAVIASEDQRFPLHHGFDTRELRAALADYLRGAPLRGASTLTQQVAKNLFLWPGRSLVRKSLEAGLTTVIELSWPKTRTLEVYLNLAEFGDGVYGVEAACRRYWGHSAARVSPQEAALLASVLPSPRHHSLAAPSPKLRRRAARVRRTMGRLQAWNWLARLQRSDPSQAKPTEMSVLRNGPIRDKPY